MAATMEGVGETCTTWMTMLGMGERREERTIVFCRLKPKPIVKAPHHCRFVAETGSDIPPSIYYQF
jgi:hypothetical protein